MSAALIWRSLSLHRWTFSRTIDSRFGDGGQVEGMAEFTQDHDDLRYKETGSFRLTDGTSFDVRKTYIWRRVDEDALAVHFDEGDERIFHIMRLRRDVSGVQGDCERHLCDPDRYDSEYRFEIEGEELMRWSASHQVDGPAKDYTSVTMYERAL